MYRLYGNVPKLQQLDISDNEEDIIETIGDYIYRVDYVRFIIILHEKNQDFPYKTIYSINDYINYIEEYRERDKVYGKSYIKHK